NEVKKTNADFKDSMEKYADWIVENGRKIDDAVKSITELSKDIDFIRQENINLKKIVSDLTFKMDILEQASRENTVEIQGIPFVEKENVMEMVEKVSMAISFPFDQNMVDKCYRIRTRFGASENPGSIVVRFVRNIDMQMFIQKRRDKRNLNTRDIGFLMGNSSVIYINHSLTPAKGTRIVEVQMEVASYSAGGFTSPSSSPPRSSFPSPNTRQHKQSSVVSIH
ncbi:hypothetical protein J6590_055428, partial [Homalodisca vitripennis]